jgi:hypothetical protein
MARSATASSTFTIIKPIEELALFWRFAEGTPMSAGLIDGEMEITIDMNIDGGDWHVSDVWIDVENHRFGKENKSSRVNLDADRDERFMLLVLDAIEHQYYTRIEAWVQDELASARYEVAA